MLGVKISGSRLYGRDDKKVKFFYGRKRETRHINTTKP